MVNETTDSTDDDAKGEVARWVTEIKLYDDQAQKWHEKSKKIIRRFKDERSPREGNIARFNVLWSNVQTLLPALYSKPPKPDIERRFKDADPLGRVASDVMERAVSYFVGKEKFNEVMRQAVLDRLLPGRGTIWVRYVPHFRDAELKQDSPEIDGEGEQVTDDAEFEEEKPQEVYYEEVCADYVHWQDFGHNIARTWEEVNAVWRIVYLDRKELKERFGDELGKEIPLDYTPKGLNDENLVNQMKKASIYEIWDKKEKRAIWIHKDHPTPLDERPDPLRLPDFFPCPRPIYVTLAGDSLIPVPDYVQYQDQAQEIDDLTSRIACITKAIKVAGVYDASASGVERLLAEGVENQLIPVEGWAVFGEKGGLKGAMELLPVKEIAETLLALYQARDAVKKDLHEITGMSDIMRGDSDPDETASAQKIKSSFGMMRLRDMQGEVQRFARDAVRIMTIVISEHFSLDTIKKISGVRLMMAQEKQMAQMQIQQQQQMAQHPPQPGQPGQQQQPAQSPPPIPDEMQEMLDNPTWEEVEALLRDDAARCFKIDIEINSTIKMDEEQEKASRVEFLRASGEFLQQATQIQNPTLVPLLCQMMMFGVRAFHAGKELESAFSVAMNKLEREAANPTPKPDPEMAKVQGQMQLEQAKMQMEQGIETQKLQADKERMQMDAQVAQAKQAAEMQQQTQLNQLEAQRDALKMQHEKELEMYKAQVDRETEQMRLTTENDFKWRMAQLDAETKVVVAQIQSKTSLQQAAMSQQDGDAVIDDNGETVGSRSEDMKSFITKMMEGMQQMIVRPKKVVPTRGADGKIASLEIS